MRCRLVAVIVVSAVVYGSWEVIIGIFKVIIAIQEVVIIVL